MLMDLNFSFKCACGWASHPWIWIAGWYTTVVAWHGRMLKYQLCLYMFWICTDTCNNLWLLFSPHYAVVWESFLHIKGRHQKSKTLFFSGTRSGRGQGEEERGMGPCFPWPCFLSPDPAVGSAIVVYPKIIQHSPLFDIMGGYAS